MTLRETALLETISQLGRIVVGLQEHHKEHHKGCQGYFVPHVGLDFCKDVVQRKESSESELKVISFQPQPQTRHKPKAASLKRKSSRGRKCKVTEPKVASPGCRPITTEPLSTSCRWEHIATDFIKSVPGTGSWVQWRESCGLRTNTSNAFAVAAIIGYCQNQNQNNIAKLAFDSRKDDSIGFLLSSAGAYAKFTLGQETNAILARQLHGFQEIVFTSFCAVLEDQNLAVDAIDRVMRMYLGATESFYLSNIRRGARWVNKLIVHLEEAGWHSRATEIFLLCKIHLRSSLEEN